MSFDNAPTPGRLVDYASPDGQTTPAVIAELLDPQELVVRLAVPPHISDSCIRDVPYAAQLTYGHWSYRPKPRSNTIPMINPYGVELRNKHWFSASQLKIWQGCQTQWGFKFLEKTRGQNRYAARGDEMHGFLHGWLAYGIPPPEDVRTGRLARTGITGKVSRGKAKKVLEQYLPLPNTADVEQRVNYISRAGYIYNLSVDFAFEDVFEDRLIHVIGDHKSTTDFKWALTKEELPLDIQGLIYAARAFSDQQLTEVQLRWLYYLDDKVRPSCRKIEARLTRTEVEDKFQQIDALSAEIELHGLTKKSASELPRNAANCHAKGGCPYLDICPVTDKERLVARMEQSSLREKLMKPANGAARDAKTSDTIAGRASSAPAEVPGETVVEGGSSLLAKLKAKNAATAAAGPTTAPAAAAAAPAAAPKAAPAAAAPKAAPAAPKAAPAAAGAPAGAPDPTSIAAKLKAKADASKAAALAAQAAAEAAVAAAEAEAEAEAAAADQAALAQAEAEAAAAAQSAEEEDPEATSFNPADVNPPEGPADPIQDAAVLAEANAAALPPKPVKAGRPKGAATVKPVSDEGYVYAHTFSQAFNGLFDPANADAMLEVIEEIAARAVKGFRKLQKELGKAE